jgi:hypothetical protein
MSFEISAAVIVSSSKLCWEIYGGVMDGVLKGVVLEFYVRYDTI